MTRRAVALGLAAGALVLGGPADAAPICQGGSRAGVCVTVIECSRVCTYHPVVDPYCNQGHPAIGGCSTVDALYVDVLELIPR